MRPVLFALVDAVLSAQWQETYDMNRRLRSKFRNKARLRRLWHENMTHSRVAAVGEWRSLWPVVAP